MPLINITIFKGRTRPQIENLYAEVTDAVHRALLVPKSDIRIYLNEIDPYQVAVAGAVKPPRAASPEAPAQAKTVAK